MQLTDRDLKVIKENMFGIIALGIAYVAVKTLDKATEYKEPKGNNKNRYK
jgi:hypothetical protein